ncbi:MAG TPA: OmcA/MtrC family decaheme c-type cytochrome, partial [Gemmatimonadales bacterium]|nr:OmcA/MtrC family decaheme c-type cytochrome [Gemmatimonadales bacterium]
KAGTPYEIIGFSQGVNDFSTVVFPQDVRNCTTCHRADLGLTNSASWYTFPSSSACGSCHDDLNFTTGANHVAGAQPDSACANCHQPQGSAEWDAGITTAHTVPLKSKQLPGLNAKIVSIANSAPGQKPTVKFQLTNGDGTAVTPAALGSNLNLLMGGPTTDYGTGQNSPAQPFRENASGATFDGTTATYTFTNAVPANATGTWAFSIEARRSITLNPAPKQGPTSVNEGAFNPVAYAAVTDAQPAPRRQVVDIANCNKCHDKLALHGGQRFNPQECVICHNPNGDDSGRRPADKGLAESIDFKRMIHRIHTGEELLTDIEPEGSEVDCKANPETFGCFTIYGFGTPPSVNNFNEVRFPGDRRDCQTCHAGETEEVLDPAPAGLLPTITQRDWYSPQQHYAAACLGCHDGEAAAAHAFSMTVTFPNGKAAEACATCHGPNAEFAVDKVHAR